VGVDNTWGGWDATRQRPLLAGCAIGQRGTNGPGTLGCFVSLNGSIYILSNLHVLKKTGAADKAILQPSHMLGGTSFDEIASFFEGEPKLDAALARVSAGVQVQNITPEGMQIGAARRGIGNGAPVRKRGVATRERAGTVVGANPTSITRGDLGPAVVMTDQILVARDDGLDGTPTVGFQVPGDSGSLVVNAANEVVALMHGQVPGVLAQGQATLIAAILDRWPGLTILGPGVHTA
jgi:hypothetical protein